MSSASVKIKIGSKMKFEEDIGLFYIFIYLEC